MTVLRDLFWSFARIGPITFGGGYAMIPSIEREAVTKRGWIDEREMSDLLSVAGSVPGGVGVNVSAYIGYRLAGIPGAVASVIGITLPTFLIVLALSLLYHRFEGHPKLEAAMLGIHGAILGLICVSAYRMAKNSMFDFSTWILGIGAFVFLLVSGASPLYLVLSSAAVGAAIVFVKPLLGLRVRTEKQPDRSTPLDRMVPEYYI